MTSPPRNNLENPCCSSDIRYACVLSSVVFAVVLLFVFALGALFAIPLQALDITIGKGQTAKVCSSLKDFINEVRAQTGKKVPADTAAQLLEQATRVGLAAGC